MILSDLEKLCLFFINSNDGLHMLIVYLLCGSDKLDKNVFHIKVCFQGEQVVHSQNPLVLKQSLKVFSYR